MADLVGTDSPSWNGTRLITVVLAVCTGVYALVQNMIAPAVPAIDSAFSVGIELSGLLYSVFLTTASISIAFAGQLAKKFRKKWLIVASLGLATLGGLLATFATSFGMLIAGRALQGLLGMTLPLSVALVREFWPEVRVAPLVGALTGSLGLGGCLGVLTAGPITSFWGYQSAVAATALSTLLAGVLVIVWLPSGRTAGGSHAEWARMTTVSLAIAALFVSLDLVPRLGAGNFALAVVAGSVAVIAFSASWMLRPRRADRTRPRVRWSWVVSTCCSFLGGVVLFVQFSLVPYIVEGAPSGGGLGLSALVTGLCLFVFNFGLYLGSWLAGLSTRFASITLVLRLGCAVAAVGMIVLMIWIGALPALLVSSLLVGLGVGAIQSMAPLMNLHLVDEAESTATAGTSRISKNLGSVFGGQVVALALSASLGGLSQAGIITALAVATAASVVCVLLSLSTRSGTMTKGGTSELVAA